MDQQIEGRAQVGGLAGWLLARLRRGARPTRRLILRERIALGPRQHVALIEADGRCFLIATGADGAPAFHPLSEETIGRRVSGGRVSW